MAGQSMGVRIAGGVLVVALAAVAVLVFVGIYVALPADFHVWALITMGLVALLLAGGAYLARAVTPNPMAPRAASWGFAALGFGLLILTVVFAPSSVLSFGSRVDALILVLLALAVAVGGAIWMGRSRASDARRADARSDWASRPPTNALTYSTAQPTPVAPAPTSPAAPSEGKP